MTADSTIIADAIYALPKGVLAGHSSLLEDVNLASVVTSKVRGVFDKSMHDSLARKVKAGAEHISTTMTDTDVAFRLLAQLSQTLDVPPRQFASTRDVDDVVADIVCAAVVALRKADKNFTGATLQDLVQFTVELMFGEVGKRFDHLAAEQQADLLNEIRAFIAQLPHEQQSTLRDKVGIGDLSDDYLRKALLSGGLASAFAGAVSIGGFGFYTGAVSLLATVAGFVGLTLPFTVYASVTSAVAVGSNPLFFVPVVGIGGFVLFRTQNDALRKRLAVNTVVQLALAGSSVGSSGEVTDNRRRAIAAWKEAAEGLRNAIELRTGAQDDVNKAERALSVARSSLKQVRELASAATAEAERLLRALSTEIETAADDIASGAWGEEARRVGLMLSASLEEKRLIDSRSIPGHGLTRFLGQVDRAFETAAAKRAHDATVRVALDQILALYKRNALGQPERVGTLLSAISAQNDGGVNYAAKIHALSADQEARHRELESAKESLSCRKRDVIKAGNRYWGLAPNEG